MTNFKFATEKPSDETPVHVFAQANYAGDILTIMVNVNGVNVPLVGVEARDGKLVAIRWNPSKLYGDEPFQRDGQGRVKDKFAPGAVLLQSR